MNIVNARAGRQWVKEGWRIYRSQPLVFLTLLFLLIVIKFVLDVMPVIGQLASVVVTPVLGMAIMQACRRVDAGEPAKVSVLIEMFRSPAFLRLTALGSLYLLASLLAVACSTLVDDGAFWKILSTGVAPKDGATVSPQVLIGMLSTMLFYLPAMLVFWYAAPLIVWRNMGVMKSVFFSVVAVKRNATAFLTYGFTWLGFGFLFPMLVASIISMVMGSVEATIGIVLPLSFVITTVMYCSFYPTYTDVFGKPDALIDAEADQPAT